MSPVHIGTFDNDQAGYAAQNALELKRMVEGKTTAGENAAQNLRWEGQRRHPLLPQPGRPQRFRGLGKTRAAARYPPA